MNTENKSKNLHFGHLQLERPLIVHPQLFDSRTQIRNQLLIEKYLQTFVLQQLQLFSHQLIYLIDMH
jgi:hypothetical protein